MAEYRVADMPHREKWRKDGSYAYRCGRKPLRIAVTQSTANRWTGILEWFPRAGARDPHRIPLTRRFDTPEKAMVAAEKALHRFDKGVSNLWFKFFGREDFVDDE